MIYGSVCSGIEAASVAWHSLGWTPAFFSEIDSFPRAVLAERWPNVPIHGDFTTINEGDYEPIDLLVGGTPCQDFSVAGLRAGLAGDRGGLTIEFAQLARRLRPHWLVWENVPGILSIDGGRAFGAFLRLLGQCGYGFAYRVLDAQHFGVPQRRRRVFVIGYLGDWRPPAAVLFESESLRGDSPPSREAGERVAASLTRGADGDGKGGYAGRRKEDDTNLAFALNASRGKACSHDPTMETFVAAFGGNNTAGEIAVSTAINAHGGPHGRQDFETETFIAHSLRADGFDAGEDGTGRGTPLTPGQGYPALHSGMSVRRLTPRECERLQGFPDDYTLIASRSADGQRYRALGNSMAVPCMRWLGERIQLVEALL